MVLDEREWFFEAYTPNEGHAHRVREHVVSLRTAFQQVDVVELRDYGRALLLDGTMQSAEADEYIYHETLLHPALCTHPRPERVLVVGGGEGATLREALRHPSVVRVDAVEIDPDVVEVVKTHLAAWHAGAFEDPRTRLVVQDGRRFVETAEDTYDVIVVDASDPNENGVSSPLFTRGFYTAVRRRLRPGGLIAIQAGTSAPGGMLPAVHRTLQAVFPIVRVMETGVPSFALPWAFALASTAWDPAGLDAAEIDRRIADREIRGLRAYDGLTHEHLLRPRKVLRNRLALEAPVLEDPVPAAAVPR